jgi:hypothetical protein
VALVVSSAYRTTDATSSSLGLVADIGLPALAITPEQSRSADALVQNTSQASAGQIDLEQCRPMAPRVSATKFAYVSIRPCRWASGLVGLDVCRPGNFARRAAFKSATRLWLFVPIEVRPDIGAPSAQGTAGCCEYTMSGTSPTPKESDELVALQERFLRPPVAGLNGAMARTF